MVGNGVAEFGKDDGAGDAHVCGDGQGVAGVVVDPAQDFGVGVISEPPVGEVGLPALIGLFGGEADVGGLGAFLRVGVMRLAAARWRWMVLTAMVMPWWCCRCQAMVCGPWSRPLPASSARRPTMRSTVEVGSRPGLDRGRRERGSKAASPSRR